MALVSVIIPVYNVAPWLSECLDSVINQTYNNLEILLIDDGSTDGSSEICEEYAKRDERITVLHINHRGLSATRNAGLDHATGDIIFFLDSDDVAYPHAIERVVAVMEQTTAQIVVFGVESYNMPGRIVSAPKEGIYDCGAALRSIVTKQGIAGAIWTKAFRASVLHDIRFPEGHNYVDISVFFQALDSCGAVYAIPDQLVKYRKRPGSITTSNTPRKHLDGCEENRWLYEYAKKHNTDGSLDDVIERIELGKMTGLLGSYSALYDDKSSESEAVKQQFREAILQGMKEIHLRETRVWIAVEIFRLSPRLFVKMHRLSHKVFRKNAGDKSAVRRN